MLKTFNINEHYESQVIPFLQSKGNQSKYICDLILADMNQENRQEEESDILALIKAIVQEEIQSIKVELMNMNRDVDQIKGDLKTEFRVLEAKIPYILRDVLEMQK